MINKFKKNLTFYYYLNRIIKIFFFFKTFFLRFKFFRLKNILLIPSRHLICINIYHELNKIFSKHNLDYFLMSGLLLGAIRQKAFAGRPKDFDIGILDKDFKKLLKLKKEISNKFDLQIAKYKDQKKRKFLINKKNFWFRINGVLVDIFIFKKIKKGKFLFWKCNNPEIDFLFPYKDLIKLKKISIYGNFLVHIPNNAEKFLKDKYGLYWRKILNTKESKNFTYSINKFKNTK